MWNKVNCGVEVDFIRKALSNIKWLAFSRGLEPSRLTVSRVPDVS